MKSSDTHNLPKCELISTLIKKAKEENLSFDVISQLDLFRKTVEDESKCIIQIFREHTPHDDIHLNNLFKIADTLLGENYYDSMTTSELLLLCIGLYGHDWGMAVSKEQKKQLLSQMSSGTRSEIIEGLLNDEIINFENFLSHQGYSSSEFIDLKENEKADDLWLKYIRETHAERSGARVKQFFFKEDTGISLAADLICKGHTEQIKILENDEIYSTYTSVLGNRVNLKAITLYCRLIDLFDFADNRTPYVIWKYVSPENPISKMEWAKHRALRQITCRTQNNQRTIVVNGSTNDHEVFAALRDLQVYCNDQVLKSQEIFARMNDSDHIFDIFGIDWDIKTEGFEPISIQFEFDRERMFTILSDEIYQGDHYVFLRELLQNSIDAIKVRRKLRQDKDESGGDIGKIQVTVNHQSDGDTEIIWKDDGIGMDEHIIRNYLAVAGNSYYVSEEFEKLNKSGIAFDPISKYGIGILTCFLVADQIEIQTYRDLYCFPNSFPLKIIIPDKTRQFRIEKPPHDNQNFGTTVRIFVKGRKISQSGSKEPLKVTEYLKIIAGFVEFPIIIEENGCKTIILHPDFKSEEAIEKYGTSFQIFQQYNKYPWNEVILPRDLNKAKKVFTERTVNIKTDLGLNDYEGWITYLIPKNEKIEILNDSSISAGTYFSRDNPLDNFCHIRWNKDWEYSHFGDRIDNRFISSEKESLSRSSTTRSNYRVYYNGILVANAEIIDNPFSERRLLPNPNIFVNIKKSQSRTDLSRNQLTDNHWFSPISEAISHQNFKIILKILSIKELSERWYGIGRLLSISYINTDDLFRPEWLPYLPIPFIKANGKIFFKEFKDIISKELVTISSPFEIEFLSLFSNHFIYNKPYEGLLNQWVGKTSVPLIKLLPEDIDIPDCIYQALEFSSQIIEKNYQLDSIKFINPPWEGNPPIVQKIYKPKKTFQSDEKIADIIKTAIKNPKELSQYGRSIINDFFSSRSCDLHLPIIIQFPSNFRKNFTYGLKYINLDHPLTQKLIQTGFLISVLKTEEILTPHQIGELDDIKYTFNDRDDESNYLDYSRTAESIRQFWETCCKLSIIDDDINSLIPTRNMFIPNTFGKNTIFYGKKITKVKNGKKFGNWIQ